MKVFNLIYSVLILTAFFANSINAQTEKKPNFTSNKIARVNTKNFEDEKLGIKDLVIAYKKLETEIKPQLDELNVMVAKLEEIRKEISHHTDLSEKDWTGHTNYYSQAKAKFEEYNKLYKEFESKLNDYKALYEKRRVDIVSPTFDKISKALEQFRKEKGYVLILNDLQNNSSIIVESEAVDITSEFIKFCNESFEKDKTQ